MSYWNMSSSSCCHCNPNIQSIEHCCIMSPLLQYYKTIVIMIHLILVKDVKSIKLLTYLVCCHHIQVVYKQLSLLEYSCSHNHTLLSKCLTCTLAAFLPECWCCHMGCTTEENSQKCIGLVSNKHKQELLKQVTVIIMALSIRIPVQHSRVNATTMSTPVSMVRNDL